MKRKTGINQLDTPKSFSLVSDSTPSFENDTKEESLSLSKKNDDNTSTPNSSTSLPSKKSDKMASSGQSSDGYEKNSILEKIKLQDTFGKVSSVPSGCSLCRARWESSLSSSSSSSSSSSNTSADEDNLSSSSSSSSLIPQEDSTASLSCNNRSCSRSSSDSLSRSRKYTKCDIALHCSINDCWLSAHGKVYDVTSFIHEHPGGKMSIMKHAGTDSTMDFDFHSASARTLWSRYEIGILIPCEGESTCIIV